MDFLSSKLMGNGKEMNLTLKNKTDVLKFYMFYTRSHVPEQAKRLLSYTYVSEQVLNCLNTCLNR
jgi:hypothetical protein